MNDDPENPDDLDPASDSDVRQPFESEPAPSEDDLAPEQDDISPEEKAPAKEQEDSPSPPEDEDLPHSEESPAVDKFAFIRNQPAYIKIIASLLFLTALLWFGMPRCTSTPPEKNYRIAIDSSWYPLKLKSKEKSMTNFTKMLFSSIATAQELKLRLVETGPNLFALLQLKEADGIISILPPPDLSSEHYIASDPIYLLGFVLVVKTNSPIKMPDKIAGKLIGIIGNAQILIKIAHYPSTIFTNYLNSSQALADLDNNIIDGVVMDILEANSYIKGLYAGNFTILYPPLISEGIELYLHKDKDSEIFMELFDEGLKKMRENGTYRALIEQWGLIYTEPKNGV